MTLQGAGFATAEGTQKYFEQRGLASAAVKLGRTGWSVSPVGFGGYRVNEQEPEHRKALEQALLSGCNLIDTSSNYGDGSSERLIGGTLRSLFASGRLSRDQVVVVTKAGYIQGSNQNLARERATEGRPFPEVVEYSPDCWHAISPEFLKEQLDRSLERLGLETVDALLLHNPEYFLKAGGDHAEYYRRIRAAFEHLEEEAERGRIRFYGVSSNTFPDAKDSPEYTSLEVLLEIAGEIGPTNRFGVIQFPFNFFEPGAAVEQNNTGKTLAELAAARGLGTLVNRPLNAFARNRLVRLADFPHHHGVDTAGELRSALEAAFALEESYPGNDVLPVTRIAWAHILKHNLDRLSDLDSWKGVLAHRIRPELTEAIEILEARPDLRDWARKYQGAANRLFERFTAYLEQVAAIRSRRIVADLDQACPALKSSPTLSRKAIRIYRSIPGIHCVLVGMRRREYVTDSLGALSLDDRPLTPEQAYDCLEAISFEDDRP